MDFNRIDSWLDNNVRKAIDKGLDLTKTMIDELSPTDTEEFIDGTKIKNATIVGNTVSGSVINASSHAYGVEGGFNAHGGNPVNWHKGPPRGPGTFMKRAISMAPFSAMKDAKNEDIILKYIKKQYEGNS